MDPASYKFLQIEIGDDGVALITMTRPEKVNALRPDDHTELVRVLPDIAADDRIRCAVITGSGRAFSAGGDFTLVDKTLDPETRIDVMEEARQLVHGHLDLEKPIIAAVNGLAGGAGAAFALLCDVVIADRSAVFADGHIRGAMAAGDGGVLIWPISVGMMKAKRYLLTGDFISAEEAERIGLITEVVDDGTCLEVAMELARRMAASPQTAVRYTKRALNQLLRDTTIRAFEMSLAYEMLSVETGETAKILAEWKAGVRAKKTGVE